MCAEIQFIQNAGQGRVIGGLKGRRWLCRDRRRAASVNQADRSADKWQIWTSSKSGNAEVRKVGRMSYADKNPCSAFMGEEWF